jgi:hypothetical protein
MEKSKGEYYANQRSRYVRIGNGNINRTRRGSNTPSATSSRNADQNPPRDDQSGQLG